MLNQLVLVLNCGSSSLKFSIINPNNGKKILFGIVDSLLLPQSCVIWTNNSIQHKYVLKEKTSHIMALNFVFKKILKKEEKLFRSIVAIGHRVVHGGEKLKKSILIDKKVINYIEEASCFAPLHNPVNICGIKTTLNLLPNLSKKNVAVFDTAFHQTMPESSYLYAIPYFYYTDYNIRRYGAHGISHQYITYKTGKILNKSLVSLNIISCHLGNGASVAAICRGLCVDTSMGLTPLEGLVMGTRSGDIDPAIIFFMNNKLGISIQEIYKILTVDSGLLGLNGKSSDFRYAENKYYYDKNSKRSIDIFCHRLAKYISGYTSLMEGRLDAVVFTGGIGENSVLVRELTLSKLSLLGIKIDIKRNLQVRAGFCGFINLKGTMPILVIPSNEDLIIAQETISLINKINE
ncbi:acetate kinase [Buchnera aphidicola]|uniref:acetate kinase n=1 Tax=Buchnera aphidicola TaxID=9 RepID=UPI003464CC7B